MLIESTYRLLSTEASASEGRGIVASDHSASLGQELRPWICRFLITRALMAYVADLPVGVCCDATIIDMMVPLRKFTAYVRTLGPPDAPDWQETRIPDRSEAGVRGILIRIASSADCPLSPDQEMLDRFIICARGEDAASLNYDSGKTRFTIITDAHSATMFCSYPKDGGWSVIPYHSVYLTDDVEKRLPESYAILAQKKVGIVGCGALGSKIAASLARSGVCDFLLVDDDIFTPANLIRHELDVESLGAHKAEALAARLRG
jgi:hypothetical protein